MNRTGSTPPQNPHGSALILSLIFIAVSAALAAAQGTVAGANVQLSDNYRKADTTRCSAESGLEVIRYWLSRVDMSGKIAPGERFNNRSSLDRVPAGFVPRIIMRYDQSSYTEAAL